MHIFFKLSGAIVSSVLLIAGTVSANADIGRDDVAATAVNAGTKSVGIQVALNPQPLPPRCASPPCKSGGGGIRARAAVHRGRPPH